MKLMSINLQLSVYHPSFKYSWWYLLWYCNCHDHDCL